MAIKPHPCIAVVLWCVAIAALYGWSTSPALLLEDDGYFVMAGFFAGAAHPPGYPTFLLLLKSIMQLPWGSIAWKAHFASGLCATASCLLLAACVHQLTRAWPVALLAGSLLAITPVFWSQAQIADVYTLNCAIFLGLFYMGMQLGRAQPAQTAQLLYAMALLAGLGLANHWPLLVMASPGILWLMLPFWRRAWQHSPGMLGCFLLGLLPYAWMVWRTQQGIPFLFIGPIESWDEFRRYLLREYYNVDHSPTATLADRWQFVRFFLESWVTQFTVPGWLLALFGLAHGLRQAPRIVQASLISAACTAGLLLSLIHFDYDHLWREVFSVYPLVAYALTALWLGLGLHALLSRLEYQRAAMIVAAVLVIGLGAWRWPSHNMHAFDETRHYAEAVLSPLPANSIMITEGDVNTAVLGYYHLIENLRPDITLLTRDGTLFNNPLLPLKLSREQIRERINGLVDSTDNHVFFTRDYRQHPSRHWQDHGLAGTLQANPGEQPVLLDTHIRYLARLLSTEIHYPYYWWDAHQKTMRQRLCYLLGRYHSAAEAFTDYRDLLQHCGRYFEGLVGYSEGRFVSPTRFSPAAMLHNGQLAERRLPILARRREKADALNIQIYSLIGMGDYKTARILAEQSLQLQPGKSNPAYKYQQYATQKENQVMVPERGIEPPTY